VDARFCSGQPWLKIRRRGHDGPHRYSCCRRFHPPAGVVVETWRTL